MTTITPNILALTELELLASIPASIIRAIEATSSSLAAAEWGWTVLDEIGFQTPEARVHVHELRTVLAHASTPGAAHYALPAAAYLLARATRAHHDLGIDSLDA